jgi:DNA-binding NarL/FixJ family response regulator
VAEAVALFRWGIVSALTRDARFTVLEARDLEGLLRQAAGTPPDAVILGLDLPPAGAIAALPDVRRRLDARVLVIGPDDDPGAVAAAMQGGANGYLSRDIAPDGLVRAVRAAVRGEVPIPRHAVADVIAHLRRLAEGVPDLAAARARMAVLSDREREVVELIASGLGNREIAGRLVISQFTVKRHVQNILRKLGLHTRAEAASLAMAASAVPAGGARGHLHSA